MASLALVDEKALRLRMDGVYSNMRQRAKPRKFKAGKRAGHIRVPGLDGLPFTRQQLWDYAVREIGFGVKLCPYCMAIGRNATPITLESCVFDHKVPVAHGGSWELSNLVPVCAQCNNEKGHLTYPFFIALVSAIEQWPDQRDRKAVLSCLRTHGVTQRIRFEPKAKTAETPPPEDVKIPLLPLKDNW